MLRKSSKASNSETLKKFEEFMKKRLEKKVILHVSPMLPSLRMNPSIGRSIASRSC